MSAEARHHKEAIDAVDQSKFEVILSKPDLLLFDFDDYGAYNRFKAEYLPWLTKHFCPVELKEWPSKSSRPGAVRMHVSLRVSRTFDVATRLAIQAACGSDGNRELMGVLNMLDGDDCPTVLFRPRSKT